MKYKSKRVTLFERLTHVGLYMYTLCETDEVFGQRLFLFFSSVYCYIFLFLSHKTVTKMTFVTTITIQNIIDNY